MSTLKKYLNAGLSIIPVKNDKRPDLPSWKEYTVQRMSLAEASNKFKTNSWVGLICGLVSNNVECIDIDTKYDISGKLWDTFSAALKDYDEDMFNSFVIQRTQSGGYHIFYRFNISEGNQKLAMRPATDEELQKYNAKAKHKISDGDRLPSVLIETRGEGGYAIISPSAGYELIQGDFDKIPKITIAQRYAILAIAKTFNLVEDKNKTKDSIITPTYPEISVGSKRAGDSFNEQHTAKEILEGYGWREGSTFGDLVSMVRPNTNKRKSGVYIPSKNIVHIFSTSTPLPSEKNLNPFMIYAYYEHGGDYKKAAKDLYDKGYGEQGLKLNGAIGANLQAPKYKSGGDVLADNVSDGGENNTPFRVLGFRKDGGQIFSFYVRAAKVVVELAASKLTKPNLLTLAPAFFWESNFPKKTGFNLDAAQNWIIQTAYKAGVFRADMIRGRGAWMDKSRLIIHAGQYLLADGKLEELNEGDNDYIYEQAPILDLGGGAASENEVKNLNSLVSMLPFANVNDSILLMGWCALAPICGVLHWRPHLWITGGAGTGKSWVLKNIIRQLLTGVCLEVQGDTSEAGVRQALGIDALPVVFDEAEATTQNENAKIQSVLGLMRSASADDGGMIMKGTKDGVAKKFTIRSMFAFASIGVSLEKQSDRSRVTVLDMQIKGTQKQRDRSFANLERFYANVFVTNFAARFRNRMFEKAKTVLDNSKIFTAACRSVLRSQRASDQIGVLLAGYFTAMYGRVAEFVEAEDLAKSMAYLADVEPETDEQKLYNYLMEHITDVETVGGRIVKRTVGELVDCASCRGTSEEIYSITAHAKLMRIGLRVETGTGYWGKLDPEETAVIISNNSNYLKNILKDTPWANNHGNILKRLINAKPSKQPVGFGGGVMSRATIVTI
jgi:putative DNA primase/helicase